MNKWDLQKENVKRMVKEIADQFLMFGVVGVCCNCVEIVEIFFAVVGGGWCLFISFFSPLPAISKTR